MKSLRTYTLLKNFALQLVQPFISFVSAANGIMGEQLALISSASTVLPSLAQFALGFLRVRAKTLVTYGTALTGLLWIALSFSPFNWTFTSLYLALEVSLGVSSFGWYLLMETVSATTRGRTLAHFSFYATIGGLVATVVTGFVVGDNFSLVRLFFLASGVLLLADGLIAMKFDVDSLPLEGRSPPLELEVMHYLLITFLFNVVWSMAWPLFPVAQVYIFHMDFINLAVMSVISGLSTLSMQKKVGKLVDEHRRLMMFLGRFALSTFPLAYALSTSVYEIYLAEVVAGFTNSVGSTAYMAYLFDSSRDVRRGIGAYSVVVAMGDLVGSSVGSLVADDVMSAYGVGAIRWLFAVIAVLRMLASAFYLLLKERKPFKEVARA
ncbi:MAG: MFS transporter [Candidatus Aramenus sp.]|jgi:MFS family permease|nr:MFS transporter [Candidatus Aramenus sp.]